MEYGLSISDVRNLPGDPREFCSVTWRHDLPPGPLRAIYFGSEFCEDLVPGLTTAIDYCLWAREAGLETVILTSTVTDKGLKRVARLYEGLTREGWNPAVVFNDWGVFNLLRQSHPNIRLHAGRLINRALRDPRLIEQIVVPATGLPRRGERIRKLLRGLGVVAVETDSDLEGGFLGSSESGLQRVLHLPYTFVASGRNCLIKADATHDDGCFTKGLGKPCKRPCQGRWHQLTRPDVSVPLWRSGNTTFYEVPHFWAEAYIAMADRIVLHDRPQS